MSSRSVSPVPVVANPPNVNVSSSKMSGKAKAAIVTLALVAIAAAVGFPAQFNENFHDFIVTPSGQATVALTGVALLMTGALIYISIRMHTAIRLKNPINKENDEKNLERIVFIVVVALTTIALTSLVLTGHFESHCKDFWLSSDYKLIPLMVYPTVTFIVIACILAYNRKTLGYIWEAHNQRKQNKMNDVADEGNIERLQTPSVVAQWDPLNADALLSQKPQGNGQRSRSSSIESTTSSFSNAGIEDRASITRTRNDSAHSEDTGDDSLQDHQAFD